MLSWPSSAARPSSDWVSKTKIASCSVSSSWCWVSAGSGRVERRSLSYQLAHAGECAWLQRHNHGRTAPRGTAVVCETFGDLLDDARPDPGARDVVAAVCAFDDQRRLTIEPVGATTPDAETQDPLVADLSADGRPIALPALEAEGTRAKR